MIIVQGRCCYETSSAQQMQWCTDNMGINILRLLLGDFQPNLHHISGDQLQLSVRQLDLNIC